MVGTTPARACEALAAGLVCDEAWLEKTLRELLRRRSLLKHGVGPLKLRLEDPGGVAGGWSHGVEI